MNRMPNNEHEWRLAEKAHRRGKIFGGMLLVGIGVLFILREARYDLPDWLFTWKSLLIALGLFFGVKHGFRRPGWLIPLCIGIAFIVSDHYSIEIKQYLLPGLLILVGIVMMLRPTRHYRHCRQSGSWNSKNDLQSAAGEIRDDDFLESTNVFGGVKRTVISKSFKGGDVVTVFGGTEINLMQADFEHEAELELTQVFGGTRLIIPAHWKVRSSVTTVIGGLDDKRSSAAAFAESGNKVLKLSGTTVVGGIEINTF